MTIVGIYVHGFFLVMAVGLPYLVLFLEGLGIARKDQQLLLAAKITSYVWAISFAFGAVTGTLVEFGLVQIWSGTILAIGSAFFLPMFYELFAFLAEIVLLPTYLYTWGKLRGWIHWLIGLGVLIGSNASAYLILAANSWMQVPWGTGSLVGKVLPWTPSLGPEVVNATAAQYALGLLSQSGSTILSDPEALRSVGYIIYDPGVVFQNPDLLPTFIHTVLATIVIASFETAAVYSYMYLRTRSNARSFYKRIAKIAFGFGGVASILQPLAGDLMGRIVYEYQYVKFLAAEGFPPEGGVNPILGIILHGDPNYYFKGLDYLAFLSNQSIYPGAAMLTIETAREIGSLIHVLYYTMVVSGVILFIIGIAYFGLYIGVIDKLVRKILRIDIETLIIYLSFAAPILALAAASAGWAVREIGRRPWAIYGLVRKDQVITPVPISFEFSLLVIAIILLIFAGGLIALYYLTIRPLRELEREVVVIRA
jgi:cytochrome d ubiquinol oxidase subunit I